jgi:hypothetical protein
MNKGRLSEEFRGRTKAFAASVIRWYVKLPQEHEECGIETALTTPLEAEANELMAIFTTMINKTKRQS